MLRQWDYTDINTVEVCPLPGTLQLAPTVVGRRGCKIVAEGRGTAAYLGGEARYTPGETPHFLQAARDTIGQQCRGGGGVRAPFGGH